MNESLENPDLSILIVTWHSGELIGRCLESLPAACGALDWELIVHDNASTDETVSEVRRYADPSRTMIVESESNLGFAGGLNAAIAISRGRFILLLNPDCVTPQGSIESLVSHLEKSVGLAGVVPLLVDDHGEPQRDFQLRRLPTMTTLLAEILLLNRLFPGNRFSSSRLYREAGLDGRPVVVEQPAGAAILLRRDVVEAVGSFDERFFPAWFEDVDYCRRLHDSGARLELVPSVVIQHRGGSSLSQMKLGDFLSVWYRNLYLYADKWMSQPVREMVRVGIMAGAVLRMAAISVGHTQKMADGPGAMEANRQVFREAWRRWKA